jgi:hypothetical protein
MRVITKSKRGGKRPKRGAGVATRSPHTAMEFHDEPLKWTVISSPGGPNEIHYGYRRVGNEVIIPHSAVRVVPVGEELDLTRHKPPKVLGEWLVGKIRANAFGITGCHSLFPKEKKGKFEKFE